MCRITDKLILCSCDSGLDLHDNHWVLNRFREGREEIMIGQPMLPYDLNPEIESFNIALIEEIINQGGCFDFETEFQEKDQLVLFFKNDHPYQEDSLYAFEFSEHKWGAIETEHLMLNWYHDTIRKGWILRI